jgi:colanic acid/amylovoran biosynthesis glycosyltransferase
MRPRRVAYVVKVFPKLSETFIAHELAELRRRGVELCVLSQITPADGIQHKIVQKAGLDQITCYEPERFMEVLRQFKPELLHAHFATEPTACARELAAALRVPFTFTAHGYDIRRKPPADFRERAAAAKKVITVSKANAEHIHQVFQVPAEHIRIIPCGVDTRFFQPATPARKMGNPPLIVCVARHVKVKNLQCLMEACGILRDRGVLYHCVLVGDGPCRGELEEAAARLKIKNEVTFAGAAEQEDVVRWWQTADIGVLTSENEGMPVCLMEAAACEVPTVATAVGGIPELIEDRVTGLLAEPNSPASVAESIQYLLENPTVAERMGLAGRVRAERQFSLPKQADQLLQLWDEILD